MWAITGGAGFIGSVLLWRMNQEGMTDALVADRLDASEKWKNLRNKRFSDYLEADDFAARLGKNQFPKLSGIVHLGACSSTTETDAAYLIRNNFEYTKTLAQWAAAKKKPFIYASSAATYGDGAQGYRTDAGTTLKLKPLNMYGYSKHLFDLWAAEKGLLTKFTGIKFFNVYGPNEYHKGDMRSVVVKAFEQIRSDGKVRLFKSYKPDFADGEQRRDFLYVKDAVAAVWSFMAGRGPGGLVNLGSGKARTWKDLVQSIFSALGRPPQIEYIPMPESLRDRYQYHTEADMTWRAKAKGRDAFHTLEDGVSDYVKNYLAQPDPYL